MKMTMPSLSFSFFNVIPNTKQIMNNKSKHRSEIKHPKNSLVNVVSRLLNENRKAEFKRQECIVT